MATDGSGRKARRAELFAVIVQSLRDLPDGFSDDTPLITSGLMESLSLLELALWVESQIDPAVELSAFDLAAEWDTPNAILDFVEHHRTAAGL